MVTPSASERDETFPATSAPVAVMVCEPFARALAVMPGLA
jgi:hypothetical protein